VHWRPRDNDRELYFLSHTLATNDVRVAATVAARHAAYELTWTSEQALRARTMRDLIADPKHPGEHLAVIPDGYFQLAADGRPLGFAVELDRGTVEEKRFQGQGQGAWRVESDRRLPAALRHR